MITTLSSVQFCAYIHTYFDPRLALSVCTCVCTMSGLAIKRKLCSLFGFFVNIGHLFRYCLHIILCYFELRGYIYICCKWCPTSYIVCAYINLSII